MRAGALALSLAAALGAASGTASAAADPMTAVLGSLSDHRTAVIGAERPWRPDMRAAKRYASERSGVVRISVRARGRAWGWRATESVHSASVLKAMLLVAYLDHPSVRGRALTAADRALIDPMIRWSDNATASRILGFVGADAVRALARRARMRRFVLDPAIWGRSLIDADDQTRFFRWIDQRVVARHRKAALRLLRGIVPAQRWGVGQVRPRGWALYFKGGWGSGSGLVEHQVALLRRSRRRVAVAVLTTGSPDHAYATETLRGVFARLLRGLRQPPARRASARSASRASTARNVRTT